MQKPLSKSKLMAFRQCPKRLWLEIKRPQLRSDSNATQKTFTVGHQVGDIARQLYDPDGQGVTLDPQQAGFAAAFAQTQVLLKKKQAIFEAGFSAEGALAFADVMLPATTGRKRVWRMVEVKSSTQVKNYHLEDAAVQAYVAKAAGAAIQSVALAFIDSAWTYPGGGDYQGLLKEEDISESAFGRAGEVGQWIADAQKIAAKRLAPKMQTGGHCSEPFACGFLTYCQSQEPQARHPAQWLPRIKTKALKEIVNKDCAVELADVPDHLLNAIQLRVKKSSLTKRGFFDKAGAKAALAGCKLPAYFLDFETIQFAVPIWKGTRPYQSIPFQFSIHTLSRVGKLSQAAFLDLSGKDPSRGFAESLVAACGKPWPVFVYNASFETARMRELGQRFPDLSAKLQDIICRVFDLQKVAGGHYYHPSQQGSWSLKKVLPAIAPDLDYALLEGVQDGGMAMDAYLEAIAPQTPPARKREIETQLLTYCERDTFAMVRLWQYFNGLPASQPKLKP